MSDHRGDFKLATYNIGPTLSPVNDFMLAVIKQSSVYRFKEIACGLNGVDWNGSGSLHAELTFYRGEVVGNPFNQVSGVGLKVGQIPVSLGQLPPAEINPFNRALHMTAGAFAFSSFYALGDQSGGNMMVCPSIDVEIECDFMVLSMSITTNLWSNATALLASRGFTHPINFYHQNNFQYLK